MQQPHRLKVGASVVLLSVPGLAQDWGISLDAMDRLLDKLQIPRVVPSGVQEGGQEAADGHGDGMRYVSLWPLESALFRLGLPAALQGERTIAAQMDIAGLLYGAVSKQVIRDRLRELAKDLRKQSRKRK